MGPTLAGGQVRAPLRGMASQDYEFETGLSPAGQVRVRMGPARAGVPPPASACLQARELLLARRELLTLDQAHNQRSKLLVRQRCKPQQAGVQPLQLAFRHRVGSTPPTRSSARGRCNQRRRISAARDRRPRSPQDTLDLGITRRLTATARCAVTATATPSARMPGRERTSSPSRVDAADDVGASTRGRGCRCARGG